MKKEKTTETKQKIETDKLSELEKTEQALKEEKERNLRLQAEFANFKKRSEENQAKIYEVASSDIFTKLIDVFDDFELALKNCTDLETFKKGIELVYAKLINSGETLGLEKIQSLDKQFNPHEHEALLTEKSNKAEQTIIEELQPGYKLKNKVLRTAKVKVATK